MALFVCSPHINQHTLTQGISSFLRHSTRAKRHRIRAKQVKSEFLFGVLWSHLGNFGDNEGQKPKIFLKSRKEGRVSRWSAACLSSCPLVKRCAGSLSVQDLPECRLWSSGVVLPSFLSALSLCACRVACRYASIWRFKGIFRGFYGVCVGLCRLPALRGLCGFCVRE